MLSHFGHGSPTKLCCTAKILHLPVKKTRRVEPFVGNRHRKIQRESKCLSQQSFCPIQIDYSMLKGMQTDIFSTDPHMIFYSFLLRCHIPFPKSALG